MMWSSSSKLVRAYMCGDRQEGLSVTDVLKKNLTRFRNILITWGLVEELV